MLGEILNSADHTLVLVLASFSIFSKNIKYIAIAFILKMIITELAGKTTEFNLNVIATIGITLSLSLSVYLLNQNRMLKRKETV